MSQRTAPLLPAVDAARVGALIERFARDSSRPGPGVTRLGFTGAERAAHAFFAAELAGLGCEVRVDAVGNTIAELPGLDPSLPAIGTGSHLDSVPSGGRFDGIAGVVAAMEATRAFVASGVRLRHTLRIVAFACEEGARFGQACVGSRLIAGLTPTADLETLRDADGVSIATAMGEVGLDASAAESAAWSPSEIAGFIELHIEQGAVLDSSATAVGVVDVVSGSTRLVFDLTGRASHTGGTPMHLRADALAAAARIIEAAELLSNDAAHAMTRMTVGRLDVSPGSITTIPGHCRVYVDVRDTDGDRQRRAADELIARAYAVAAERGISISTELLADTSPVALPARVQDVLIDAARSRQVSYRVLASGASHDAQMINRVCPTGMIFIPSLEGGVSHSPEESSSFEDLATGADVLAAGLLLLDDAVDSWTQAPR